MGCTSSSNPALPTVLQTTQPQRKPHRHVTPTFAVDEKSPVKITIRILQARNLLAKDASGTSDPYAEVSFGLQRFRTDVVPMSCNPVWYQAEFHIDPYFAQAVDEELAAKPAGSGGDKPFPEKILRIELFDDDSVDHSAEAAEAAAAGGAPLGQRKFGAGSSKRSKDVDDKDDFLGRVDLLCPLWEHESQKWYLLRQRSKRSRVAGEVEIYVKVQINVNVRDPALGPPPFAKIAVRGRQPLRPYPSSHAHGQDFIIRAKIFNEYFALPQYYCEVRPDALIIRMDSQLAPVFVILKCLITSSHLSLSANGSSGESSSPGASQDNNNNHGPTAAAAATAAAAVLKQKKKGLFQRQHNESSPGYSSAAGAAAASGPMVLIDIHLRGYANRISIQAPADREEMFARFLREAEQLPATFPKRQLRSEPEFYGCGQEYFAALYESLMKAKDSVFIAGWMFTPEIYLKRDEHPWHSSHRLESILKAKAEEGVKVFVLIYNDRDVVGVNAAHVVDSLEQRHPNIHVGMHAPARTKDIYWSHHSKLVVIDWSVCFVGGMDLCVGRFDTAQHSVVDVELPYTFLGSDYYNPRVRALERLDKPFTERFDRHFEPRLPWQDITARYEGQIARDCGMYFVHRWTFSLLGLGFKMKQGKRAWILPPAGQGEDVTVTSSTAPTAAVSRAAAAEEQPAEVRDVETQEAALGEEAAVAGAQQAGPTGEEEEDVVAASRTPEETTDEGTPVGAAAAATATVNDETGQQPMTSASTPEPPPPPQQRPHGNDDDDEDENHTTVQLLRSFPYWAGFTPKDGVTDENSIYQAMLHQIESAERFIYIENQFFISSAEEKEIDFHLGMFNVVGAPCMQLSTKITRLPTAFVGNLQAKLFYEGKQHKARQKRRGGESEFGEMKDHMDDRKMGYREDVLNLDDDDEQEYYGGPSLPKRVANKLPKPHLPHRRDSKNNWKHIYASNKIALALFLRVSRAIEANEDFCIGIVLPDFPEGHYATETYTRVVMHFQQHTICRGPHSLFGRLASKFPGVDLSRYIQFFALRSFGFVGHFPLQEGVYVHSKLLICDDTVCLVGSANVNDRSLVGSRDSETAILLETTTPGGSSAVRAFRRQLWARHLGLDEHDDADAAELELVDQDPVRCLRELWRERAKQNTKVFESVWPNTPSNRYTKFRDMPASRPGPYFTCDELKQIKGKVTDYPMYFLSEEVLTAGFDKEGMFVDDVMFM